MQGDPIKNRKEFHRQLQSMDMYSGDMADFEKRFSNADNLTEFYGALREKDMYDGDIDDFKDRFFSDLYTTEPKEPVVAQNHSYSWDAGQLPKENIYTPEHANDTMENQERRQKARREVADQTLDKYSENREEQENRVDTGNAIVDVDANKLSASAVMFKRKQAVDRTDKYLRTKYDASFVDGFHADVQTKRHLEALLGNEKYDQTKIASKIDEIDSKYQGIEDSEILSKYENLIRDTPKVDQAFKDAYAREESNEILRKGIQKQTDLLDNEEGQGLASWGSRQSGAVKRFFSNLAGQIGTLTSVVAETFDMDEFAASSREKVRKLSEYNKDVVAETTPSRLQGEFEEKVLEYDGGKVFLDNEGNVTKYLGEDGTEKELSEDDLNKIEEKKSEAQSDYSLARTAVSATPMLLDVMDMYVSSVSTGGIGRALKLGSKGSSIGMYGAIFRQVFSKEYEASLSETGDLDTALEKSLIKASVTTGLTRIGGLEQTIAKKGLRQVSRGVKDKVVNGVMKGSIPPSAAQAAFFHGLKQTAGEVLEEYVDMEIGAIIDQAYDPTSQGPSMRDTRNMVMSTLFTTLPFAVLGGMGKYKEGKDIIKNSIQYSIENKEQVFTELDKSLELGQISAQEVDAKKELVAYVSDEVELVGDDSNLDKIVEKFEKTKKMEETDNPTVKEVLKGEIVELESEIHGKELDEDIEKKEDPDKVVEPVVEPKKAEAEVVKEKVVESEVPKEQVKETPVADPKKDKPVSVKDGRGVKYNIDKEGNVTNVKNKTKATKEKSTEVKRKHLEGRYNEFDNDSSTDIEGLNPEQIGNKIAEESKSPKEIAIQYNAEPEFTNSEGGYINEDVRDPSDVLHDNFGGGNMTEGFLNLHFGNNKEYSKFRSKSRTKKGRIVEDGADAAFTEDLEERLESINAENGTSLTVEDVVDYAKEYWLSDNQYIPSSKAFPNDRKTKLSERFKELTGVPLDSDLAKEYIGISENPPNPKFSKEKRFSNYSERLIGDVRHSSEGVKERYNFDAKVGEQDASKMFEEALGFGDEAVGALLDEIKDSKKILVDDISDPDSITLNNQLNFVSGVILDKIFDYYSGKVGMSDQAKKAHDIRSARLAASGSDLYSSRADASPESLMRTEMGKVVKAQVDKLAKKGISGKTYKEILDNFNAKVSELSNELKNTKTSRSAIKAQLEKIKGNLDLFGHLPNQYKGKGGKSLAEVKAKNIQKRKKIKEQLSKIREARKNLGFAFDAKKEGESYAEELKLTISLIKTYVSEGITNVKELLGTLSDFFVEAGYSKDEADIKAKEGFDNYMVKNLKAEDQSGDVSQPKIFEDPKLVPPTPKNLKAEDQSGDVSQPKIFEDPKLVPPTPKNLKAEKQSEFDEQSKMFEDLTGALIEVVTESNMSAKDKKNFINSVLDQMFDLDSETDQKLDDMAKRALDVPHLPSDIKKSLDIWKNLPEGDLRNNKVQDVLDYIKGEIGGIGKTEMAESYFHSFVLSNPSTWVSVLGGFFNNLGIIYRSFNKGGVDGVSSALEGVKYGLYELGRVVATGKGNKRFDRLMPSMPLEVVAKREKGRGLLGDMNTNVAKVARFTGRIMEGLDAITYHSAYRFDLTKQARNVAISEGLKGKEISDRVNDLVAFRKESMQKEFSSAKEYLDKFANAYGSTFDQMFTDHDVRDLVTSRIKDRMRSVKSDSVESASEFGRYQALMNDPKGFSGITVSLISRMASKHNEGAKAPVKVSKLWSRLLFPYLRTWANMLNMAFDYVPVVGAVKAGAEHYLMEDYKREFNNGEFGVLVQKQILATGAFLGLVARSLDDEEFQITAHGPKNFADNMQWKEQGNKPMSIRYKGTNIVFRDWPIAGLLMSVGAISDAYRYNIDGEEEKTFKEDYESQAGAMGLALFTYAKDGSLTKTFGDIGNLVYVKSTADALNRLVQIGTRPITGYTNPGILKWFEKIIGNDIPERTSFSDNEWANVLGNVMANVPVARNVMFDSKRNMHGDDIDYGNGTNIALQFTGMDRYISSNQNPIDEVINVMNQRDIFYPAISRKVEIELDDGKVEMDIPQKDKYDFIIQRYRKKTMSQSIDELKRGDRRELQNAIKNINKETINPFAKAVIVEYAASNKDLNDLTREKIDALISRDIRNFSSRNAFYDAMRGKN